MRITYTTRSLIVALLSLSFQGLAAAQPSSGAVGTLPQGSSEQCVDPQLVEQAIALIPSTHVCERQYVAGKYVCKDFARDECLALRSAGIKSWKVAVFQRASLTSSGKRGDVVGDYSPYRKCVLDYCLRAVGRTSIFMCLFRQEFESVKTCFETHLSGHAWVTAEITDASTARARLHAFALYDPQDKSGPDKFACTWRQENAVPIVPDFCRKILAEQLERLNGGDQVCPNLLDVGTRVVNCNDPMEYGDRAPVPSPTPIRPPKW